ncbi:MAG TPA: MTAP family purine nucleoside phosphorylase [Tepidisphaeraceae bacterium]|nr:MTAP family purine nucleoside phosphorylase [Tepidisphaeraceae bacterium]
MSELRVGLIGGTGLGEALGVEHSGTRHEVDTPFGRPSDAILEAEWAGVPVLILSRHGRGHVLSPSQVPYRANLFALKQLGCTHILASGAVGSLREEYKPRQLVIPDQIIDRTSRRPATFYERAAVHVEFAEPFCPVLRQLLLEAGSRVSGVGNRVSGEEQARENPSPSDPNPETRDPISDPHPRGCYVAMEGPAFSTRAESLMHRLWGGDLIGMTAMPEAKLAREAEIPYALVALVTDYDCWRHKPPLPDAAEQQEKVDPHLLLKEIMGNLRAATDAAVALVRRTVELMAQRRELLQACPASRALELAIWSDKASIAPDEVARLAPLWGKYFASEPPPAPALPPAPAAGEVDRGGD